MARPVTRPWPSPWTALQHRCRRLGGRAATAITLAVATVATTFVAGAASAQFGQAAGFGDVMRPYYIRRDLQVFVDRLDLDETQRAIVESLFFDYESEEARRKEQMLEDIAGLRDQLQDIGRDEAVALIFEPFERKATEWDRSRARLLEDVRTVLSDRQLEQWDDFSRTLRRAKELPRSRFAGEGLDLYLVLERMDMAEPVRRSIEQALVDWELELDAALLHRERQESAARIPMMRAIRDDAHDEAVDLYDREIAARVAVREVNDRHLEQVAAALPPEIGSRFRVEALRTGYPSVYRRITGERIFDAALEAEGLDEEIRADVEMLRDAFFTELEQVNWTIVEALREYEPMKTRHSADSFARRSAGAGAAMPPADPTQTAFGERKQLEIRYVQLLRELVGDAVFARLPGAGRFMQRRDEDALGADDPFAGDAQGRRKMEEQRERIRERRGIGAGG